MGHCVVSASHDTFHLISLLSMGFAAFSLKTILLLNLVSFVTVSPIFASTCNGIILL